jgi:hypothetical protein
MCPIIFIRDFDSFLALFGQWDGARVEGRGGGWGRRKGVDCFQFSFVSTTASYRSVSFGSRSLPLSLPSLVP